MLDLLKTSEIKFSKQNLVGIISLNINSTKYARLQGRQRRFSQGGISQTDQ